MARSPWRDALDGQIAVLRCLRGDAGIYHLGVSAGHNSLLQAVPNEVERSRIQIRCGAALAAALMDAVQEAEPIHLTHDIIQRITRQSPATEKLPDTVLTRDMLPIPAGLVWFGTTGIEFRSETPELPGALRDAVTVRAIYFGKDLRLSLDEDPIRGYRARVVEMKDDGMGLVLFLDSTKSGYAYADTFLNPSHLVPIPLGSWIYDSPLIDSIRDVREAYNENEQWDSGTMVLMAMSYMFLHHLFTLMLQRVTLWGGVGLNRQEQKDAEREHLRPRVQLVTWRKAHYKYPEGHIPVPVSWSCRWSVREHYRRYKSGKTVKIQSYVKGPPGKPFVLPVDRANIVKR